MNAKRERSPYVSNTERGIRRFYLMLLLVAAGMAAGFFLLSPVLQKRQNARILAVRQEHSMSQDQLAELQVAMDSQRNEHQAKIQELESLAKEREDRLQETARLLEQARNQLAIKDTQQGNLESERQKLESDNHRLNERIRETGEQLSALRSELDGLKSSTVPRDAHSKLQAERDGLQKELAALQKEREMEIAAGKQQVEDWTALRAEVRTAMNQIGEETLRRETMNVVAGAKWRLIAYNATWAARRLEHALVQLEAGTPDQQEALRRTIRESIDRLRE